MKTIYNVIINFTSKKQASDYFKDSGLLFAYECENLIYNIEDAVIAEPENCVKYNFGEIWIEDTKNPVASQLFIEDGFLMYFKETFEEQVENITE